MTQIIYILDGKNLLINEADDSIEKINTKIRNGEWRYPFRFDTPKTFQIDEILVVSGSSKKNRTTSLTSQQTKIVERLMRGESVGQIALALGISPDTVNYHIDKAKRKFNVETRNELIAAYSRESTTY